MDHQPFRSALFSFALALALLIPVSAPAITENSLETAPPVTLPEIPEETAPSEYTAAPIPYLPYDIWIPDRSEEIPESEAYSYPRLTNSELERIRGIMADLAEGRDPGLKDLGFDREAEKVHVGVFPLDPQDFDGETFYVLLPDGPLTDGDLFSLIAAFDRLGIPFDPDSLNGRNCVRAASYTVSTRGLSYEESERMRTVRHQLHRGIIDPEDIPAGTYCRCVETDWWDSREYLTDTYRFSFYPYRSMTDEELAAFALAEEGLWDTDPDLVEKQALDAARSLLNVPLSLASFDEQMSRWKNGTRAYDSSFLVYYMDERTGEEISPVGQPYECLVSQQQFPDSDQIVLHFVDLWFYTGEPAGDRDTWPVYTESEWIAQARQWAKEYISLPEEQLPEEWQIGLSDPDSRQTEVSGRKAGLYVSIVMNQWDAGICSVFVARN